MTRTDPSPDRFRQLMVEDEPGFEMVLSCVFGIQNTHVKTYLTLLEMPASTVKELADELDRDRSNVNRSLSTLREKSLVTRDRRLLDEGGHVYQYTTTPLAEVRELMHETLDEWTAYVHDRIDEFGDPAEL